jgi:hypothetical protein
VPDVVREPCVHCGWRRSYHRGGLCQACWVAPGVRERYVERSPYNPHLLPPLVLVPCWLPARGEPTWYRPGTSEKLSVLASRVEAHEAAELSLFVPGDAEHPDPLEAEEKAVIRRMQEADQETEDLREEALRA